jgi:ribosomal protein L29
MSKAKEIRELSDEQLALTLTESQRELFNLRFQSAAEKKSAPSEMRKLRRSIARINTIQRERALAATK